MATAFWMTVSRINWTSVGDVLMTRKISAAAD
jgi:hypothetical protein